MPLDSHIKHFEPYLQANKWAYHWFHSSTIAPPYGHPRECHGYGSWLIPMLTHCRHPAPTYTCHPVKRTRAPSALLCLTDPHQPTTCYAPKPYGSSPHTRECVGRPNKRFIGNEITKSTMYNPQYKWDYIVPKYSGPITIYKPWKVCPNVSLEHSKL